MFRIAPAWREICNELAYHVCHLNPGLPNFKIHSIKLTGMNTKFLLSIFAILLSFYSYGCGNNNSTTTNEIADDDTTNLPPVEKNRPNTDYKPAFKGQTRHFTPHAFRQAVPVFTVQFFFLFHLGTAFLTNHYTIVF